MDFFLQPSGTIEEEEEVAMAEAMADELEDDRLEDDRLDDGAIDVGSDDKFHWY